MRGLTCNVFRWEHDCTNGGLTSRKGGVQRVLLVRENGEPLGPFSIEEAGRLGMPVLYLREWHGWLIACPEALPTIGSGNGITREAKSLRGWMFGGNFIYTSDGRFPSDAPIRVFDRQEG